ncbi:MAG TPA: hypothetical protein DCF68_12420 [Cyanothece sp. UBA12306]|nr:hypothetical protein [Cyanothece sp. UBA12306]
MNTFDSEQLELLAAGYVLDDLDEEEMAQVEELIQSSPAMREQIRQSLELMGMVTNSVEPVSPPMELKDKITSVFPEDKNIPRQKTIINLDNWFQDLFETGWQMATELLETPTVTPAFRNSGVAGAKLITIGSNNQPIILIVRVKNTTPLDRDVEIEILSELQQEYLPSELQLMLLDSDENIVMEATTRQENRNLKFEFAGTSGETFSVKLRLFDDDFKQTFTL